MSHFSYLSEAPTDPIFGLLAAFSKDGRKNKVNLGIGIYKNEALTTPLLSCVKMAEELVLPSRKSYSYLPVEGDPLFLQAVSTLILGASLYASYQDSLTLMQTVGGTSALYVGGKLLSQKTHRAIYIPNISWSNHLGVFTGCGLQVQRYPYYDMATKTLDFVKMQSYFSTLPEGSAIVLHVCCHNPSGTDLSTEQWTHILELCKKRNLIPFLDAAYLGFDLGVYEDAFPIRYCVENKIEFFLALSFSKNLSLYAERVGYFMAFSAKEAVSSLTSQGKLCIRSSYSNPPSHGAALVSTIITTPFLHDLWKEELVCMKQRICEIRNNFFILLTEQGAKKNYDHIKEKKGLFSVCDFSVEQIDTLITQYGIYLTGDGRINVTGLSQENLTYVAKAIVEVGG